MPLRGLVAAFVIAQILLAGAVYRCVDAVGATATRRIAEERLSLLSDTLRSTIDRFVAVPRIAGESRSLAALLLQPQDVSARAATNAFLEQAAQAAGLAALYVLDDKGLTLAASNWREATSFVGHHYAFRPYFSAAIAEGHGRYYGVGVATGQPDYFVSSRVTLAEGTTGVVVAKIDFSPLQASWTAGGEQVLVADDDGIVFLATDPALLYRPLQALEGPRAAAIRQERRYTANGIGRALSARTWPEGGRVSGPIAGTPWRMIVVIPPIGAWAPAGAAALSVLTGLVLVLAAAMYRQKLARLDAERAAFAALEARVQARTQDLADALGQLEIAERQRIDGELHRARDDLAQTAKLAAMGQAFAGLAHEVNQPLAALRTYLSSLRVMIDRDLRADAQTSIAVMEGAVQRLVTLTDDLRRLARRADDVREVFGLDEVARRVAALMKFRFADKGVALRCEIPAPVAVCGNANRLEQVVLNLVLNALDAACGQDHPLVTLEVFEQAGLARLSVTDSGPGVPESQRMRLFEPFFTTKPDGVGLGLAIGYAIVRDHGGTLEYERSGVGETRFLLSLPLASASITPP